MSRKWLGFAILIAVATLLLNTSSCGFNQHLVSIEVEPSSGATFGGVDPSLIVDFTATGTYDHPPETKDITSLVTWVSDTPGVAQVKSGAVSPNTGCGVSNVYATFYDSPNQVTSNYVTITVDGPASLGCTPAGPQPILTVTVAGTVSGTVTSSPAGISCNTGSSCSSQFVTGQTILLTASPASSFQSWQGCNTTDGATCTVFLENSTTVTATFN